MSTVNCTIGLSVTHLQLLRMPHVREIPEITITDDQLGQGVPWPHHCLSVALMGAMLCTRFRGEAPGLWATKVRAESWVTYIRQFRCEAGKTLIGQ